MLGEYGKEEYFTRHNKSCSLKLSVPTIISRGANLVLNLDEMVLKCVVNKMN
jgi:hypothetical protein